MKICDAAGYLSLSVSQLRNIIRYGMIPVVRLPNPKNQTRRMRRVLIDSFDLDELIRRNKCPSADTVASTAKKDAKFGG
jgi:hypothetical protein